MRGCVRGLCLNYFSQNIISHCNTCWKITGQLSRLLRFLIDLVDEVHDESKAGFISRVEISHANNEFYVGAVAKIASGFVYYVELMVKKICYNSIEIKGDLLEIDYYCGA